MFGPAAFSPDGRVLAMVLNHAEVQLFDLQTRQRIGRLFSPFSTRMNALAFSPDMTRLAAACDQGRVRVWHLAAMRKVLARINLDWDLPPFQERTPPVPTQVNVVYRRD